MMWVCAAHCRSLLVVLDTAIDSIDRLLERVEICVHDAIG
jgi:hypothetical protein